MPDCPNCGQKTERTEDWACRWCGYPLLSRSYKKTSKTYKQLRDEGLYKSSTYTTESDLEPIVEPERIPVAQIEPGTITEPKPLWKLEAEAIVESKSIIVVTAEELLSAYETKGLAADKEFTNKILKVTGIITRILINDFNNRYEIDLTGTEEHELGDIQCTFDKSHLSELNRLVIGQTVTVQGQYNGFVINSLLKDCMLVY